MAIKVGTSGDDTLNGTSSADTLYGKEGLDRLSGLGGADILYGGVGKDILIGGAGKDTLTGGPGADTFKYLARSDSRGTTVDLIKDFKISDGDSVDLTAVGFATHLPSYDASFAGLQAVFTYNATTNVTTLSYYEGSSTPVFQLKFTGNVHYDTDNFRGINPTPFPTEFDDLVEGTPNSDTVNLLGGDDIYRGLEGNDSIAGGSGDDNLYGFEGNDTIRGGSGADYVSGGSGNDTLYGGTGNDDLQGGGDSDIVYGGDGNDLLEGFDGDDFLYGQQGDDQFIGISFGNDTLNGGDGYDVAVVSRLHLGPVGEDNFSDFKVTKNPDGTVTLTDLDPLGGGDYGTDTLIDVEAIQFNDGAYVVATDTFTPDLSVI